MSEGCDSNLLAEVPSGLGQTAAWCRVSVVYALTVCAVLMVEKRGVERRIPWKESTGVETNGHIKDS